MQPVCGFRLWLSAIGLMSQIERLPPSRQKGGKTGYCKMQFY